MLSFLSYTNFGSLNYVARRTVRHVRCDSIEGRNNSFTDFLLCIIMPMLY